MGLLLMAIALNICGIAMGFYFRIAEGCPVWLTAINVGGNAISLGVAITLLVKELL